MGQLTLAIAASISSCGRSWFVTTDTQRSSRLENHRLRQIPVEFKGLNPLSTRNSRLTHSLTCTLHPFVFGEQYMEALTANSANSFLRICRGNPVVYQKAD